MKKIAVLVSRKKTYNSISLQMSLLANILKKELGESVIVTYSDQENKLLKDPDIKIVCAYGMYKPGMLFNDLSRYIYVFHNITPPKYFIFSEPKVALLSLLGYLQLFFLSFRKMCWIAVSDYNRCVLENYGHKNILVCPNIVANVKFEKQDKFANPSLLYVGRIVENKDCLSLLKNVYKIASRFGKSLDFYIVGKGKSGTRYLRDFERLLKQKPKNLTIYWEQSLPYSELVVLYQRCWLYITMSKHEGFGLPVCESLTYGTAAIYTKCGGQESIMNNVGLCTFDGMPDMVISLLNSKDNLKKLYNKQINIVKKYQEPIVNKIIHKVYERFV